MDVIEVVKIVSKNRSDGVRLQHPGKVTKVKYQGELIKMQHDLEHDIVVNGYPALLGDTSKKVAIDILNLKEKCEEVVGKKYQLEQLQAFESAGWRLIQVYEDEFLNNSEIVNSRINHMLGATGKKVSARKCNIVQVEAKVGKAFFAKNHIQGGGHGATLFIGLEYAGEILCMGGFGKARYNPMYQFELIRFASEIDSTVVGGGSRIIKHAQGILRGGIVSYADRRFSDGNLYRQLGFKELSVSAPCYWYFHGDSLKRFHRSKFMKHKLVKLLEVFDPEKTENQNMALNGWSKIFDSGNYVFALDYNDGE